MHAAGFWRNARRVSLRIALVLVIGFVVFEIGIRLLTPDAVAYHVQLSSNGTVVFDQAGTMTDPAVIARWRAAMTATPSGKFLWQGGGETCSRMTYYIASYAFLWHGITIESVYSRPTCTDQYVVSSGGLPDPRTYSVVPLVQPSGAFTAPVSGLAASLRTNCSPASGPLRRGILS